MKNNCSENFNIDENSKGRDTFSTNLGNKNSMTSEKTHPTLTILKRNEVYKKYMNNKTELSGWMKEMLKEFKEQLKEFYDKYLTPKLFKYELLK